MITKSLDKALEAISAGSEFVIFNGDCSKLLSQLPASSIDTVVTSPPYFMGKNYDRSYRLSDFYSDLNLLKNSMSRVINDNGNMCWQIGYHTQRGAVFPLDFAVFEVFRDDPSLTLRNRIIWEFGHGTHAKKRFSGRHETILWYGKGTDSFFNLDAVRTTQKYPGKRHYKGPRKGEYSGNPLGKNPSDVWDIPNVKSNHVEKTTHPCQFPVALVQRLIKALTPTNGVVLDPFAGSASAGIAACLEGRRFIGAEISRKFCEIGLRRYEQLIEGTLNYRPLDKEIYKPGENLAVARRPAHFATA